jgi:hypothetical protein
MKRKVMFPSESSGEVTPRRNISEFISCAPALRDEASSITAAKKVRNLFICV